MIYEYECSTCGIIERTCSYKEYKSNPQCICACGLEARRIIGAPAGYVHGITTVGKLAEHNMKHLTKSQGKLLEKQQEEQAKAKRVLQGDGPPPAIKKALATGDKQRIEQYIEKGI